LPAPGAAGRAGVLAVVAAAAAPAAAAVAATRAVSGDVATGAGDVVAQPAAPARVQAT
jgi:hypothetical protein